MRLIVLRHAIAVGDLDGDADQPWFVQLVQTSPNLLDFYTLTHYPPYVLELVIERIEEYLEGHAQSINGEVVGRMREHLETFNSALMKRRSSGSGFAAIPPGMWQRCSSIGGEGSVGGDPTIHVIVLHIP